MKGTHTRLCALFPWLFKGSRVNNPKDCPVLMATELRGLGELAFFERADLSYTSLRDIMAAQKRKPTMAMEMDDLGLWLNNAHTRTPKSRLLERAAHAWLQPSVYDRSQQPSGFFSRCWLKLTNQPYMLTPPTQYNFTTTFANCVVYCPFLKWFDMSPMFDRLRRPQPFPLLRK